jgi:ATP-dependent RNA helicase DDX19/DBP5
LEKEERDSCIEKFRKGEISVLIATNLISRGFDVHTIKLVINFDVPFNQGKPDYENYLHRIGRTGRFGDTGVALTLFDRVQDEEAFFDIIKHYKMEDKVLPLKGGATQLSDLISKAKEESIC